MAGPAFLYLSDFTYSVPYLLSSCSGNIVETSLHKVFGNTGSAAHKMQGITPAQDYPPAERVLEINRVNTDTSGA